MTAIRTARERARAELTWEIKDEARRQVAEVGAAALSLRNVAKTLGMVSSAVYRYYPSKDDLVTALVIDAYNAIGEAAEKADASAPVADPAARWRATCHGVRRWAKEHPHEYALIYGSPIPGYRAPQDTIEPAARVALVFLRLVAAADGTPLQPFVPLSATLVEQAGRLAAATEVKIAPEVMTQAVMAWAQLFGTISFELFGQFVGSFDPSDELFDLVVDQTARSVGISA